MKIRRSHKIDAGRTSGAHVAHNAAGDGPRGKADAQADGRPRPVVRGISRVEQVEPEAQGGARVVGTVGEHAHHREVGVADRLQRGG